MSFTFSNWCQRDKKCATGISNAKLGSTLRRAHKSDNGQRTYFQQKKQLRCNAVRLRLANVPISEFRIMWRYNIQANATSTNCSCAWAPTNHIQSQLINLGHLPAQYPSLHKHFPKKQSVGPGGQAAVQLINGESLAIESWTQTSPFQVLHSPKLPKIPAM